MRSIKALAFCNLQALNGNKKISDLSAKREALLVELKQVEEALTQA
jgi:hypothetical protein